MKKKLAIMMVIAIGTTIFSSCGKSDKAEIEKLQKSLNDANVKIQEQQKQLEEKDKSIEALNKIIKSNDEASSSGKITDNQKLNVYDIDINTYERKTTEDVIFIADGVSLGSKVKFVTAQIMGKFFKEKKYEISLQDQTGKKIAVLNLIDENGTNGWYQTFQGSGGGTINSGRIIENILQKEYKGQWIDGLRVLYNGKTAEFQHAPQIENVIFR